MAAKKNLGSKIWGIVSTVLVAIVVLIAVFLMGSRIFGLRVFNVISGSMEPTYSVGDLIYVDEIYHGEIKTTSQRVEKIERIDAMIDSGELKVGDPITFVMNEGLVVGTHMIIEIDRENKCFKTQGEANDTPDQSPVKYENVIGKPLFAIPLVGYLSDALQNPPGMYIAIVLVAALVVAVFLPDVIELIKKLKNKGKNSEGESETDTPAPVDPAIEAERAELERLRAELEAAKAEIAAARGDAPAEAPADAPAEVPAESSTAPSDGEGNK